MTVCEQNVLCSVRILKTLCRKLKLPEHFDYQQLARLTPGYVGADLMALCREAAMNAVNRVLMEIRGVPQNQSQSSSEDLPVISSADTEAAATDTDIRGQQTLGSPAPQGETGQSVLQVQQCPPSLQAVPRSADHFISSAISLFDLGEMGFRFLILKRSNTEQHRPYNTPDSLYMPLFLVNF